jgi:hypothetical protein
MSSSSSSDDGEDSIHHVKVKKAKISDLVLQSNGIAKINSAVFNFYVFSVKPSANIPDKDFYLTINVKHKG